MADYCGAMTTAVDGPAVEPADEFEPRQTETRRDRKLGLFLTVAGGIGLLASSILTIDKVKLLTAQAQGEELNLVCDISAFVSCSDVVSSAQSSVFGFPNPLIGIAGFSVVVTLAVLMASGTQLPRFIWAGLQAGTIFGIGFVSWLQFQSIFVIGRLCPWCMVVWTVMIPIFVLVTARNLRSPVLRNWAGLVIAIWYIVIIATIWFVFGESLWA